MVAGTLRANLTIFRYTPAVERAAGNAGQRAARAYGLVTVRQRPGTANGVLFMTLEDEAGQVNVTLFRTAGEVSEGGARRRVAGRVRRLARRRESVSPDR